MENLSVNKISSYLGKEPSQFTCDDIVKFVVDNGIEMINFMYPAADGRLKTLNFVINDLDYLRTILTTGERVDGSSLFPFIEAGESDLYVLPRFASAFVDPFAQLPTLTLLCSFFNRHGSQLSQSPRVILTKACQAFTEATGLRLQAMGELEYYLISPDNGMFPAVDQRGYHESAPFAKYNEFRAKCMYYIAQTGGKIKYGHSEVGNFTLNGMNYEQNEIEFLPVDAPDAADQLMLAKWVIRNLAHQMGYNVTFAPKITTGKAGSGLHIHMRLVDKDGNNRLLDHERQLSHNAKRLIAGLMDMAPSLTAFGNTTPTSYFRLVPHQEAPTSVCWGDCNRSTLVRVPLGWTTDTDMCAIANPNEPKQQRNATQKQTIEIRSGDGSADIYLYLAAIAVAARHGFEMDNALKLAADTYVAYNIHAEANKQTYATLQQLPDSCHASALRLLDHAHIYEALNIFPHSVITDQVNRLKNFEDADLRSRAERDHDLQRRLVAQHFHCG